MKRFLLWIISVALGVALLLAAVMGVSYAFTTQGGCRMLPRSSAAGAGDQRLLLAGAAAGRPAGQGVCQPRHPHGAEAGHPVHGAPGHYSAGLGQLHHSDHPDRGRSVVFAGSVSEYQSFLFPANGEYKAEITLWRVPKGGMATQFEGGSTGACAKIWAGAPAKPTGSVPGIPSGSPAGQRGHRILG